MLRLILLFLLLLLMVLGTSQAQDLPQLPPWTKPLGPKQQQNDGQQQEEQAEPPFPVDALRTDYIQRALKYLADNQTVYEQDGKAFGYWANDVGYKWGYEYQVTKKDGRHPGITGIVCLAFMANGHLPGRGPYGDHVLRALRFMIDCTTRKDHTPGYVALDGTRMYSHAFGTLFLAEVLGMANIDAELEDQLKQGLRSAIYLIVQSQNVNGGWRYSPFQESSDVSVVVCQLQALRAAASAGIAVPQRTIDAARAYISHCYEKNGNFRYEMEDATSRETWTLTAAGMVALQQVGNYESFINAESERVSFDATIEKLLPGHLHDRRNGAGVPDLSYFYGHYYAIQAFYQLGRSKPEIWKKYRAQAYEAILKRFDKVNNRWVDNVGYNYATGMAVLILSMENEFLPIFQK